MFEEENVSVETEEVAEPLDNEQTEDLSEENQNVADSDSQGEDTENSGKTSQDSAFAEMRRARAEAERQAQEAREQLDAYKAEQEARQKALNKLSGGRENAELEALAESLGIDVEDVIQTLEAETSQARVEQENEVLKAQLNKVETERRLDSTLNELEKLDSKLTEDDISNVLMYVDKGLSTEDAYYAVKAKEINTKAIPPKPIGKLNQSKPMEKEFYTEAEVDAMTPQQQRANYKAIMRSMSKW